MDWRGSNGALLNNQGKFQCPCCPSSFKRSEHLKRHQRCHEGVKQFSCPVCGKRFGRSDVLARHATIHQNNSQSDPPSSVNDTTSKRLRACNECARARERCSKSSPCRRCSAKSLLCTYPENVRRRQASQSTNGQSQSQSQSITVEQHQQVPAYAFAADQDQSMVSSNSDASHETTSDPASFPQPEAAPINLLPSENGVLTGSSAAANSDIPMQCEGFQANHTGDDYSNFGFVPDRPPRPSSQLYTMQASLPVGSNYLYGPSPYYNDPEFPLNWLPANDNIDIDYSSFLGLSYSPTNLQPGHQNLPFNASSLQQTQHNLYNGQTSQSPLTASPGPTISTSSPSSLHPLPASAIRGGLYATSTNGGRTPCTVRSKRRFTSTAILNGLGLPTISNDGNLVRDGNTVYDIPSLGHLLLDDATVQDFTRIVSTSTYGNMQQGFHRRCLDPSDTRLSYTSPSFPPLQCFNLFIHLYFKYFSPILPIIHDATVDVNSYWPLTLAMAAVGCQYAHTKEFGSCVAPLHEFLRRVLLAELGDQRGDIDTRLLQALLLSQVAALYGGHERSGSIGQREHGDLLRLIKAGNFLSTSTDREETNHAGQGHVLEWTRWVQGETQRRIGYGVWLIDCMMVYHFGAEPGMSLAVAQADLPHDALWAATSAKEWVDLRKRTTRNPSLCSAVQKMFQDKEVKSDLGEFSRVILLHGLYREIFQVRDFYKRPLSSWVPSAQLSQATRASDGSQSTAGGGDPVDSEWLASIPEYTSWRNAALDCADVLHWAANATIALFSGAEHPTVMHLHLSRTVLLVPQEEIITLALSVGAPYRKGTVQNRLPSRQETVAAEKQVLQWAQRDIVKARLAVLHCGCFYWHTRRYSTMAFYEPVSVFLATLSLWGYSYYTSKVKTQQNQSDRKDTSQSSSGAQPDTLEQQKLDAVAKGASSPADSEQHDSDSSDLSDTSEVDPTFVQLDRPCDDEMVQLFVRSGRPSRMKAYITGVGDICADGAPERILREGRKILEKVSFAWGRTRYYYDVLESLERAIVNRKQT